MITPVITIIIPAILLTLMPSCPNIYAPYAEMAGISEVNIFVLATPSIFIELTNSINAKPEQREARAIIGTIISALQKRSAEKLLIS